MFEEYVNLGGNRHNLRKTNMAADLLKSSIRHLSTLYSNYADLIIMGFDPSYV